MTGRDFPRSKSQLGQYERCPRAYEWSYIKKVKLMSYWAAKGIACHEAIAAHFRRKAETGAEPAPTEALAVFHDRVKEFFSPLAEAEGKAPVLFEGQSREKLEAEGVAQLTTYLKVLAPTIEPLMVEEAVEMTLPSGMRLKGRIDLVDTACRIRDAKFPTDGMKAEQLHYEADAPLYCAFYRALTGRWPAGFVFDVVALGRRKLPEPTATSLSFPDFEAYMPALVEARLADLERVDEGIKAGIFHRRPSVMNCNLCVFTNLCWHGMKAGIGVHTQAEREQPSLEPALRMSLAGTKRDA